MVLERVEQARPGPWRVEHPGALTDDRDLGDVGVELGAGHRAQREPPVGGGDGGVLGHVDPVEQVGVAGVVGATVRGHADDGPVRPADQPAQPLGPGRRPVHHALHELGGPLGAAQEVVGEGRVLGHPRHGEGVQRLEREGGDAGDQEGGVGVHPPGDAVRAEPAGIARLAGVHRAGVGRAQRPQRAEHGPGHQGCGDGGEHAAGDAARQLGDRRPRWDPVGWALPHPGGGRLDRAGPCRAGTGRGAGCLGGRGGHGHHATCASPSSGRRVGRVVGTARRPNGPGRPPLRRVGRATWP